MKKSAGFGAATTVLVAVVVVLVGFVGWHLYDANQDRQNDATHKVDNGKTQENVSAGASAETAAYLDIKELGIKLELRDEIKDLTYHAETLSDGSMAAKFSTEALTNIDANCDAAFGPLGSLEMTTVDTDRTGAKKIVDDVSIFKLGDYYITYSSPQALCSDKVSGHLDQPRSAFRDALKTMQLDK